MSRRWTGRYVILWTPHQMQWPGSELTNQGAAFITYTWTSLLLDRIHTLFVFTCRHCVYLQTLFVFTCRHCLCTLYLLFTCRLYWQSCEWCADKPPSLNLHPTCKPKVSHSGGTSPCLHIKVRGREERRGKWHPWNCYHFWKETSFSLSFVWSSYVPLLCVFHSEFSERVEQQMRTQQFRNIVREVLAVSSVSIDQWFSQYYCSVSVGQSCVNWSMVC